MKQNICKNIINYCNQVLEVEYFSSDNTLAIFKVKNLILAKSQIQAYLSSQDPNMYGLRIIFYNN